MSAVGAAPIIGIALTALKLPKSSLYNSPCGQPF